MSAWTNNPGAYRRLPGRSGVFVRHGAWLGDDHILAVRTLFAQQTYRRFYFRDIQAFAIERTDRFSGVAWLSGGIAVMSGLFTALTWPDHPTGGYGFMVFWGLVTALALIAFVANIVLGRTCTCHVKTAVQTRELPSVRRERRAHKLRLVLAQKIAEAQAGLAVPAAAPAEPREAQPAGPVAPSANGD